MRVARHIALWLAAMIVSIVGLAPSCAEAHAGHGHPAAVPVASPQASVGSAKAPGTVEIAAASLGAVAACLCPACAHGCSTCCATALAPTAEAAWPARRPPGQAASRDRPIPAGILPEAVPKPPKPFA